MLQSTNSIVSEQGAGPPSTETHIRAWDALEQPPLVLERLPSGEFAWLRPETDPRYVVTDCGRAALAESEGEE